MIINEKFKSEISPLTKDEYDLLEKQIIADGCRDALITWQGNLVDGHNRYEICTKHNIEFKTIEKALAEEAKSLTINIDLRHGDFKEVLADIADGYDTLFVKANGQE